MPNPWKNRWEFLSLTARVIDPLQREGNGFPGTFCSLTRGHAVLSGRAPERRDYVLNEGKGDENLFPHLSHLEGDRPALDCTRPPSLKRSSAGRVPFDFDRFRSLTSGYLSPG